MNKAEMLAKLQQIEALLVKYYITDDDIDSGIADSSEQLEFKEALEALSEIKAEIEKP